MTPFRVPSRSFTRQSLVVMPSGVDFQTSPPHYLSLAVALKLLKNLLQATLRLKQLLLRLTQLNS